MQQDARREPLGRPQVHRVEALSMTEHRAHISWRRGDAEFDYARYPREHDWDFEDGVHVAASAAPAYRGTAGHVDPEQAFVAALASCHMLTFLALAARRRIVVDGYDDHAVGVLEKNSAGRLAVTRVDLSPQITFHAPAPAAAELERLHDLAHQECFIANSVHTVVRVLN
jgi:organic hydroperoxide reductase OsmC/OhrA